MALKKFKIKPDFELYMRTLVAGKDSNSGVSEEKFDNWMDYFFMYHEIRWNPTSTPSIYSSKAQREQLKEKVKKWLKRILILNHQLFELLYLMIYHKYIHKN